MGKMKSKKKKASPWAGNHAENSDFSDGGSSVLTPVTNPRLDSRDPTMIELEESSPDLMLGSSMFYAKDSNLDLRIRSSMDRVRGDARLFGSQRDVHSKTRPILMRLMRF